MNLNLHDKLILFKQFYFLFLFLLFRYNNILLSTLSYCKNRDNLTVNKTGMLQQQQ